MDKIEDVDEWYMIDGTEVVPNDVNEGVHEKEEKIPNNVNEGVHETGGDMFSGVHETEEKILNNVNENMFSDDTDVIPEEITSDDSSPFSLTDTPDISELLSDANTLDPHEFLEEVITREEYQNAVRRKENMDRFIAEAKEGVMNFIKDKLSNYPSFKKILEDPKVKEALLSGDVNFLLNNDKIKNAMKNLPLKEKKKLVKLVNKLQNIGHPPKRNEPEDNIKRSSRGGVKMYRVIETVPFTQDHTCVFIRNDGLIEDINLSNLSEIMSSHEKDIKKKGKDVIVRFNNNGPRNGRASKLVGFNVGGDVILYSKDHDIDVKSIM